MLTIRCRLARVQVLTEPKILGPLAFVHDETNICSLILVRQVTSHNKLTFNNLHYFSLTRVISNRPRGIICLIPSLLGVVLQVLGLLTPNQSQTNKNAISYLKYQIHFGRNSPYEIIWIPDWFPAPKVENYSVNFFFVSIFFPN